MSYAVTKDGAYTGVIYPQLDGNIRAHHKKRGESLEKIYSPLTNLGTRREPNWQLQEDPSEVPFEVTMRQARIALKRAGYLPNVSAVISQLPQAQRDEAEIEWEYAQTVQRDSALVEILAQSIGLTDQEIDDLFRNAVKL